MMPAEYLSAYGYPPLDEIAQAAAVSEGFLQHAYREEPSVFALLALGATAYKAGAVLYMPYDHPPSGDPSWHADAPNEEKPSSASGNPSPAPSPSPLPEPTLASLLTALSHQTDAINRLANSNAMLAEAIMDQQAQDEDDVSTYLDGTPRKASRA